MLLLLRLLLEATGPIEPPTPENGPSGGANWLNGYSPKFGRKPDQRRRNKRDELLFISA